jgi:hypothetical protein
MSKTIFSNGSFLTPNFVQAIYGQGASGGHVHDSTDADGHCKQIDLSAEVTGTLPLSKLQNGSFINQPVTTVSNPTFSNGVTTDSSFSVALKWFRLHATGAQYIGGDITLTYNDGQYFTFSTILGMSGVRHCANGFMGTLNGSGAYDFEIVSNLLTGIVTFTILPVTAPLSSDIYDIVVFHT